MTQISSDSDASRALSRSQTRHRLDREMRRHRALVAAHAGRVLLLRCASKSQKFCNEFPHFFSKFARKRCRTRTTSVPHAAQTRPSVTPTSYVFVHRIRCKRAHFLRERKSKSIQKIWNFKKIRASLTQNPSDFNASRALSRSQRRH